MNITLKPIDESNFLDAFHLQLRDDQTQYVSHPIRSLAQAYVYRNQCRRSAFTLMRGWWDTSW